MSANRPLDDFDDDRLQLVLTYARVLRAAGGDQPWHLAIESPQSSLARDLVAAGLATITPTRIFGRCCLRLELVNRRTGETEATP